MISNDYFWFVGFGVKEWKGGFLKYFLSSALCTLGILKFWSRPCVVEKENNSGDAEEYFRK